METASETAQQTRRKRSATSSKLSQEASILALALSTSQALRVLVGLKLAPLGLAAGQDRLLTALDEKGPLSVSELADEINVRPSTVSKMVDRLEVRGLMVRTSDDNDKRRTGLKLTDKGRATCKELLKLCETVERELRSDYDEADVRQMVAGLELLNKEVIRRLKRLR